MKLGVFDSGIGGKAIADYLALAFPTAEILRVDDHEHVPYGEKSAEMVRTLTNAAIQPLLADECDVIILACNTATAAAIEFLRDTYPAQKFAGLEPMVKPAAALTTTGTVAICATPATLASERYQALKARYTATVTVLEPDCSSWARMIEDNQINEPLVIETITSCIQSGADVIALACTHYHWIRDLIERTVDGHATVIDPSHALARQVARLTNAPLVAVPQAL